MHESSFQLKASYWQIIKMAVSIAFSMFIPQINYFINTYFISQLGEYELANYTISGMYYLFFAVIGMSLNIGLQALMGNSLGAENKNKFIQFFYNATTLCFILAAIGIIITFVFIHPVLGYFIQQKSSLQTIIPFLKIRIIGLPFLYLYLLRNTLFINLNKSHYLIYVSLIETLSNIFLDYVFIFGHFSFPALGINGAAVASVLAEIIGFIVSYFFIHFGIKKEIPISYKFRFNISIFKEIIFKSSPIILQHICAIGGWQIFFLYIEHTGQRNLAISGVMRIMIGLLGTIPWSLGYVTNTLISNINGQKKTHLIFNSLFKICLVGLIGSGVISLIVYYNSTNLLMFFSPEVSFVQEAKESLVVILIAICMMNIGCIFLNTLIALGLTKIVLYIEIICVFIYIIYVHLVVKVWKLKLVWAWGSEILYWNTMFILFLSYLLYWNKKQKKLSFISN